MGASHRRRTLFVLALVVLAGCSGGETPATEPGAAGDGTVTAPDGTVEVHFVNVGQSVSTLVVGPTGETMLIDTGSFYDDGEYVLQYLRRQGIDRIDHLVVSHNDADHIGGNAAVIRYFEREGEGVGAVYDPGIAAGTQTYGEYLDAVEAHDVPLYEVREGDQLPIEGVTADVLGPPEPYLEGGARNENSVVLRVGFGTTSFLFPGDAEDDQEAYLVEHYGDALDATVLKAGHHGSASSSIGPFLDAVDPRAAVISSAYDSRYGHPDEAVLDRLAERSVATYWTGTHGDIVLRSDGSAVTISTQQSAPTDPRSLRQGERVEPGTVGGVQARATIAGGTPVTPIADGGTLVPTPSRTTAPEAVDALAVETVHADAAGDDQENLNDEYVTFTNTGSEPLSLSGWTVHDEADHTYVFPDGTTLAAGASVTLHTGDGTDTETDLYWGSGNAIWNNGGDTVVVRNSEGRTVLSETYP